MRTNMLREGIKVMAKLGRGIYCIVTRVDDMAGSPVAYAKEIDADDEVIEDGREFVITALHSGSSRIQTPMTSRSLQ